MFAGRYFSKAYFAGRYFAPASSSAIDGSGNGGNWVVQRRRRGGR